MPPRQKLPKSPSVSAVGSPERRLAKSASGSLPLHKDRKKKAVTAAEADARARQAFERQREIFDDVDSFVLAEQVCGGDGSGGGRQC